MMDEIVSNIDIINICEERDDVSNMYMRICVREGRDDGYLMNSEHSTRFDDEDWNNQTGYKACLRVEERTSSQTKSDRMFLNCINGEKFDSHIAAESLRAYERKLQLEKMEVKAQERDKILFRLEQGQSPGHVKRYERLYEYGKSKIISKNESACPKKPSIIQPNDKLNGKSVALNEICNRLYDKSVTMQVDGKNRRNQIDKARTIANPSPLLNRRSRSHSPWTARTKRLASEASTQQEVVDRLYVPSKPKQEDENGRRTRSGSGSFNPRGVRSQSLSRASRSTGISTKGDKPPVPQEIVARLYAPSIPMQEYGKERRQEISALGSFKSRGVRSQPSSRASRSTDILSEGDKSPISQDIVDRLYAPSISMQEYGKERREGISKMRFQCNPSLIYTSHIVAEGESKVNE